jgi:hypothetical protein
MPSAAKPSEREGKRTAGYAFRLQNPRTRALTANAGAAALNRASWVSRPASRLGIRTGRVETSPSEGDPCGHTASGGTPGPGPTRPT